MVRGEVKRFPEKGRGKSAAVSTFILAHGDELLRTGGADGSPHLLNPCGKTFLGKKIEIVEFVRVVANISAARHELDIAGQRQRRLRRRSGQVPGGGQGGAIRVALLEPEVPSLQLERVSVGTGLPQAPGEAGFINKVPGHKGNIVEARDHSRNQP